ncbi:hypothetical protein RAZWK3B_00950 [Roseobacter sp. AzwK-3b]|nr:hypothetical protein RAZWK3B_00950 [Roseobacter sp. AzwK-3b]
MVSIAIIVNHIFEATSKSSRLIPAQQTCGGSFVIRVNKRSILVRGRRLKSGRNPSKRSDGLQLFASKQYVIGLARMAAYHQNEAEYHRQNAFH